MPKVAKESKAAERFRKKCVAAAEASDVEICFYGDERGSDQFEDDGVLHVADPCGLRACFGIGQDTPSKQANDLTRAIMKAIGLAKKVGPRVLVEDIEEVERCPCCGREL